MNTDFSIVGTKNHPICQDYGRSGKDYVILADGCSSSVDSDFGARLLVKSIEQLEPSNEVGYVACALLSQDIANQLGLNNNCLDATLLKLKANEKTANIDIYGDGFYAIKFKNGKIKFNTISFKSGYPQYLTYSIFNTKQEALEREVGINEKTVISEEIENSNIVNSIEIKEDSGPLFDSIITENVEFIMIGTDGINSFVKKAENGELVSITALEVINKITNIAVYKGEFIKRRINGFLKECNKLGWYNLDDFSVGAIYFD